jgi:hypothetical protein
VVLKDCQQFGRQNSALPIVMSTISAVSCYFADFDKIGRSGQHQPEPMARSPLLPNAQGRVSRVPVNPDNKRMSRIWWCFGLTGTLLITTGLTLTRSSAAYDPRPAASAPVADSPVFPIATPSPTTPVVKPPVPAIGGILPNQGTFAPPLPTGKVAVTGAPVNLRYTFDGGIRRPITDTGGDHTLLPLGQNGGAVRCGSYPRGRGSPSPIRAGARWPATGTAHEPSCKASATTASTPAPARSSTARRC